MGRISLAVKRGVRGAEHLRRSPGETTHQIKKMKVTIISVACFAALAISAPVPEADPEAFIDLGAVALPAITGSALIDGLLLGKVAFLKAAILANLLLGSESADEAADSYGAPPIPTDHLTLPSLRPMVPPRLTHCRHTMVATK